MPDMIARAAATARGIFHFALFRLTVIAADRSRAGKEPAAEKGVESSPICKWPLKSTGCSRRNASDRKRVGTVSSQSLAKNSNLVIVFSSGLTQYLRLASEFAQVGRRSWQHFPDGGQVPLPTSDPPIPATAVGLCIFPAWLVPVKDVVSISGPGLLREKRFCPRSSGRVCIQTRTGRIAQLSVVFPTELPGPDNRVDIRGCQRPVFQMSCPGIRTFPVWTCHHFRPRWTGVK